MAARERVLHLQRHGVSEMNVYLATCKHPYGSKRFRDPLLYDAPLTPRGEAGARAAAAQAVRLSPKPDLLVVSPLTRALQTATLTFGAAPPGCEVLVLPLARERLYLSSDVGRHPAQLAAEFPHFDFSHLPPVWWHTESGDPQAVHYEPDDVFAARMSQLRAWLCARPEASIACVTHWGVIHALTDGVEFDNCELQSLPASSLLLGP